MSSGFTLTLTSTVMILSLLLSIVMGRKAFRSRTLSLASWFSGMVVFTISVGLEVLFALNLFDTLSLKVYLLLVSLIVELLALGSVALFHRSFLTKTYAVYMTASTLALIYSLYESTLGTMIVNHVFFGPLPLSVTVFSSVITFPAAAIIVIKAAIDLKRKVSLNLVSIIIGVVVVSVAGTLYIAGFPSFLYLAEFIGIFLLWLGFVKLPLKSERVASVQS